MKYRVAPTRTVSAIITNFGCDIFTPVDILVFGRHYWLL